MMVLLSLAYQSLKNRKLTTILTVISIALSVALLVGVEQVRVGARESFSNTISQTDLIVGARGGSLQLLLYAVFRMGTATNNLTYASYEKIKSNPAVEWTIPYSLGDSHRGFRVVGTNDDFYSKYRFRRDRKIELTLRFGARTSSSRRSSPRTPMPSSWGPIFWPSPRIW